MKKIKLKYVHIIVIIIGIIFLSLSTFHSNIWFDESYSVAIAKHNFLDIWKITGNDVHPALYYWMLHIVFIIFGNNVIAFRLFSVLAVVILGILGFTHIRKDFGEKVGLLFSFLAYFLPICSTYSGSIRMYSWACLLTCLLCIYAYRFYKELQNNKWQKNLIIFGIFSIACCYIHYYATVTACIVNFILLIYLIKNRKKYKKALYSFLTLALIQIVLYIPWVLYLLKQLNHVENGFWITLGLNTLVEVPSFQFRRELDTVFSFDFKTIIALIASILMYIYVVYCIYKAKKEKENILSGKLALLVYLSVIGAFLLVSIICPSAVLYSRYLFAITGIYIFAIAFFMAKEKKKWVTITICALILILSTWSNITNILINYDKTNMKQIEYLKENIKPNDIIIYSNIGNGGVIAAFFPENKQYFINLGGWDVIEAYKAYGPGMETVSSYEEAINGYTGRIWLIDSEYPDLYNNFPKDGITLIEGPLKFETKYQDYIYNLFLLEKQ